MTRELAARFARIALGHVSREYPNMLGHVLEGPADARTPRALHPIFFGSFDWHSCVHSYWMLARLRRLYPRFSEVAAIEALFSERLTPDNAAGEIAYLARPSSAGFERTYGWAWLLALSAELERHVDGAGRAWASVIRPLANVFAARFEAYLPKATYPIRSGTHANSAFALALACEYTPLTGLLRECALRWYGDDADCTTWEPGGNDFLSPALIEALCMQRLLDTEQFTDWFERFLPGFSGGRAAALFAVATVSDRSDGQIAHLDGYNLSKAWCLRELGYGSGAQPLLDASLPHVSGDYMGEHWLATYATLALAGL